MAQELSKPDYEFFNSLVETHSSGLFKFLFARCSCQATAEDLLQDLWLRVLKHISNSKLRGCPAGYLYTIAKGLLVDYFKSPSQRNWKPLPSDTNIQAPVEQEDDITERITHLRACIERLEPITAEIMRLRCEGVDAAEISQKLNLSLQAVYSRASRAVRSLHDCLKRKML